MAGEDKRAMSADDDDEFEDEAFSDAPDGDGAPFREIRIMFMFVPVR